MKILIVGGAGYVGGALTDLLDSRESRVYQGDEVKVYDSLVFEENYQKNVAFVHGDVRDREKLQEQLDWADAVVWLAAIVGDGACEVNPTLTREINQEAVKWLSENFDGRIIFMSTCSVYGARSGTLGENAPTNPLSLYALTKLESEGYLKGKNAIIFRLGTLFGLSDTYSRIRLDLVVNTLSARAVSDGKLTVFGGEQYRPLLHVRDVAQTIAEALHHDKTGVYNLHKENMKIVDLANKIQNYVPCTIELVEQTFEDSRNYRASSKKALEELDFYPQYDIDDGIAEVVELLSSGRIKDLNNPRYSNQGFLETR